MKIIKFTAENVKKLRAVEITPEGSIVEITGPNGQGKSSVLDAIFYAVAGTEGIPSKVVRQGEEKAFVKLELGETVTELVVTRYFAAAGTTRLTVESPVGARFSSPQRMLDELVGALSFDPLAFTRMKPAEQLSELRKVVKLEVDLDALDAKTKEIFEKRTAANRELKSLEARLTVLPKPTAEPPDEPVDVTALAVKLQEAGKRNAARESELRHIEALKDRIVRNTAAAEHQVNKIKHRQAEVEVQVKKIYDDLYEETGRLQQEELKLLKSVEADSKELEALFVTDPVDTGKILEEIKLAETANLNHQRKKALLNAQLDILTYTEKIRQLNESLEAHRALRQEAITQAQMPIPGLSFGDGEVIFNDLPLGNASSGEQLRVSVALAMAANPKLRILRVKDGSLLDESNLKLLADMAETHNFQVWLERVEESGGRPSIVMEDGHVTG